VSSCKAVVMKAEARSNNCKAQHINCSIKLNVFIVLVFTSVQNCNLPTTVTNKLTGQFSKLWTVHLSFPHISALFNNHTHTILSSVIRTWNFPSTFLDSLISAVTGVNDDHTL